MERSYFHIQLLGDATEQCSMKVGQTMGGLLNVSAASAEVSGVAHDIFLIALGYFWKCSGS